MEKEVRKLLKESLIERDCWKIYNKALEEKSRLMNKANKKYHLYGTCYLQYRESITDKRFNRVTLEVNLHCYKEDLKEVVLVHSLTGNLTKYFHYEDFFRDKELYDVLEVLCKNMTRLLEKRQLDPYIYGRSDYPDKPISDTHYQDPLGKSKGGGKRPVSRFCNKCTVYKNLDISTEEKSQGVT